MSSFGDKQERGQPTLVGYPLSVAPLAAASAALSVVLPYAG